MRLHRYGKPTIKIGTGGSVSRITQRIKRKSKLTMKKFGGGSKQSFGFGR